MELLTDIGKIWGRRSWQLLGCDALDLAVAIWMHQHALEDHFDANAAVRFVRVQRRWVCAIGIFFSDPTLCVLSRQQQPNIQRV
jgi:hypothetical protein